MEHIGQLKDAVITAFGQTLDSPTDYEQLSADIRNKTGELISVSTLKRLFGYLKSGTVPRASTLSILARYVGYAGWSDFCSKCSKEEYRESQEISKKAAYHNPIAHIAIMILCIGVVIIGWFIWKHNKENTEDVALNKENISIAASNTKEVNRQKYERLLLSFVAVAKGKCDSVRACRHTMDIISYKELVDSVYFPFVFTFLHDSIKRQTARTFPDDELLSLRYSNEIWERCREICAELMREIPSDELIKAYNADSSANAASQHN